jgi:uncharacterized protein
MYKLLSDEFPFKEKNIKNLISLYEDGSTVPFIARYRKEATGGMDEIKIREIIDRYIYLNNLEKRKSEVLKNIEEKGKLTEELKNKILISKTLKEVEDLYLPYKSKRKTKADIAKEAGLEPLSKFIKTASNNSAIEKEASKYINEKIEDINTAISMALDIIIEEIGHDLEIKNRIRQLLKEKAQIVSEKKKKVEGRTAFEDYYDFEESVKTIPPHRILALFRGEKESVLRVKIKADEDAIILSIESICSKKGLVLNELIKKSIKSSYIRILQPALELEFRNELKEFAEKKAIKIFAENLKNLLLTPPVKNKNILGIDPAFRTGCKYAALDKTGKLLDYGVIYPTAPQEDYENSSKIIINIIKKYEIDAIAIGNGTASRETESFIDRLISENSLDIAYTIVSEAGASVYSASEIAAKEFPELDLTIRGAISIARRVLDPLSEFVKIDPKSIGVGMYQHDVNQKLLKQTLNDTVEDVVNSVGVDLNTAGASLLQYVAGLTSSTSEKIVKHREEKGKFKSRFDLLKVSGIGEQSFQQAAGFLRIYDGDEPLDKMFIHPENYETVYALLDELKISIENTSMIRLALKNKSISELSMKFGIGELTLKDIIENLEKPEIDIRENVDPVIFKKGLLSIDDINEGMNLQGKITNVIDFGAFVDIGLKNDGLIHISELANKFVRHPSEIVSVGQNVQVKVIAIDKNRGRISLSMKN